MDLIFQKFLNECAQIFCRNQNIDLINYIFVKMKFLVNMIGRDNFFAKVWNLGQNIRISDKKAVALENIN